MGIILGVGMGCFWDGKRWEIVGVEGKNNWILLWSDRELFSNDCKVVSKSSVEVIVDEAFNIGDVVQTTNTFKGRVTAFEHETNRAICVSHSTKIQHDRAGRWAYKPHELIHEPKGITLQTNKIYQLQLVDGTSTSVRALRDPSTDRYVFYKVSDGSVVVWGMNEKLDFIDMRRHHQIEKIVVQ